MKSKGISTLIFAISLSSTSIFSQENYHNNNEFQYLNWTEEQFSQYEDSIISVLYPPVIAMKTDSTKKIGDYNPDLPQKVTLQTVSNVPTTVTIDKNKEVGYIDIKSGTSPTGAKTYQIPIDIYPGINGMQPDLSLS